MCICMYIYIERGPWQLRTLRTPAAFAISQTAVCGQAASEKQTTKVNLIDLHICLRRLQIAGGGLGCLERGAHHHALVCVCALIYIICRRTIVRFENQLFKSPTKRVGVCEHNCRCCWRQFFQHFPAPPSIALYAHVICKDNYQIKGENMVSTFKPYVTWL